MNDKVKTDDKVQVDEFQADHSDSAIADPIDTGSTKRPADKDNGQTAPQSIDSDGVTHRVSEPLIGKMISDMKGYDFEQVQSIFDLVKGYMSNNPAKNARPADKMTNKEGYTPKALNQEEIQEMFGESVEVDEDFTKRVSTIFESAVYLAAQEQRGGIVAEYEEKLTEAIAENKKSVAEKLEEYMEYLTGLWLEENKVAIESNIKVEIAEGIINTMRGMFEQASISIPDEKIDLLDELEAKVTTAEESATELKAENASLLESLKKYQEGEIFTEMAEGLVDTDKERFKELSSGITFESEEQFKEKLAVIKETYFKQSDDVVTTTEPDDLEKVTEGLDTGEQKVVSSPVSRYVAEISKQSKK